MNFQLTFWTVPGPSLRFQQNLGLLGESVACSLSNGGPRWAALCFWGPINMNTQFIISKEMAYWLVLSTIFSSWFAWKGNTKIYRGLWYVFVPINHSLYIGYIMYMCATCDLQYMDIFNYGLKSDTLVLQCDSAYISLIIVLTISHLEGICFHKSVIYSCNISVMHKAVW